MDILIMRHGESEADILKVHEGRADFPLTERGIRQVSAAADRLCGEFTIDKIFASPLKRAAKSAEIVSAKRGVSVTFNDDLKEHDNGLLAGLTFAEADAKYPEPAVTYPHTALYGQESAIAHRARAETAISKIIRENDERSTILIVSHGGTISHMIKAFLGLPVDGAVFYTGDAGVHRLIYKGGKRAVGFLNRLTSE